ncbi:hypothetical protein BST95_06710 [Halioglobus japonicus]|uniref:Uncharacterized protein n=1 Tax=Halioglobus japonicus TaxID=930805 RepID=A0AAP8SLC9_9GAMM|nr:hypothetical protein BST95_06710 [Halioglobus japonicus]PLW84497.1 hypothetical protein C0029_18895 [Halioglobus japonicus]
MDSLSVPPVMNDAWHVMLTLFIPMFGYRFAPTEIYLSIPITGLTLAIAFYIATTKVLHEYTAAKNVFGKAGYVLLAVFTIGLTRWIWTQNSMEAPWVGIVFTVLMLGAIHLYLSILGLFGVVRPEQD